MHPSEEPPASTKRAKKFSEKVEEAWKNYEEVQKIKTQMKGIIPDYEFEEEGLEKEDK